MVGDHTALVKKLNVKPEDNPTSESLTTQAEVTRNKLANLEGSAFDKAYMDNEVAYHKTVNAALSDTLIPDAQNAELRALLQSGLGVFQAHQKLRRTAREPTPAGFGIAVGRHVERRAGL